MSIEDAIEKGPWQFKHDTKCLLHGTPIREKDWGYRYGKEHYCYKHDDKNSIKTEEATIKDSTISLLDILKVLIEIRDILKARLPRDM